MDAIRSLEKVIETLVLSEYPFIDSFEVKYIHSDINMKGWFTVRYYVKKKPNYLDTEPLGLEMIKAIKLTKDLFVMLGHKKDKDIQVDYRIIQ